MQPAIQLACAEKCLLRICVSYDNLKLSSCVHRCTRVFGCAEEMFTACVHGLIDYDNLNSDSMQSHTVVHKVLLT